MKIPALYLCALGQCGLIQQAVDLLNGDFDTLNPDTIALIQQAQDQYGLSDPITDQVVEAWDMVLDSVDNGETKLKAEMAKRGGSSQTGSRSTAKTTVLSEDPAETAYLHVSDERYPGFALRIKEPKVGVDNVKQYSGYFDAIDVDKHFFFWFFESRSDPENDPTVMWLNGGPGCSSMTGLFFELGPASIGSDLVPKINPHSWNSKSNIFFLDQPVGTGLSYGESKVYTTEDAAKDNFVFLELFFNHFPQYAGRDFHIAGESYGGHYVPVFANHHRQQEHKNFNVTSILIGNGLVDPLRQYDYFEPMGCGKGGHKAVFSPQRCDKMHKAAPKCDKLIKNCYANQTASICAPATVYCNAHLINPFGETGLNIYDVRRKCEVDGLCYSELQYIDDFLNRPDIQREIGVDRLFNDCNNEIGYGFAQSGDWLKPYYTSISELLDVGIPVLAYAGDKDYICNWLGNENWSKELEWSGQKKFAQEALRPWNSKSTGKEAGQLRNYNHFTFLRVYDAGHMVPYDQPEHSVEMFNKWLDGEFGL